MREVKWLVESKVILVYGEGSQDISDVRLNNTEIKMLLDEGKAPVHLIFQAVNLKSSPTDIKEIQHSLDFLSHPNLGWIVSIGANPIINFVGSVVTNIFKIKMTQAANINDALLLLKVRDSSLNTMQ